MSDSLVVTGKMLKCMCGAQRCSCSVWGDPSCSSRVGLEGRAGRATVVGPWSRGAQKHVGNYYI
jgi:hypothetical protein